MVAMPVIVRQTPATTSTSSPLDEAYELFYVSQYEEAAELALARRTVAPDDLEAYELRTSALHFRLKREISTASDRKAALKACQPCGAWLTALRADIAKGRALAHARLEADEHDDEALFYLGKIDLTHVWLHLETLGQRTGWSEYWEARRSLDAVIKRHPDHARALVARAWIDYIVDTRVPRGFRWMLGGGNRKGALDMARKATVSPTADRYDRAEAGFALWEMLVREKRMTDAVTVATDLSREFPGNRELVRFLETSKGS